MARAVFLDRDGVLNLSEVRDGRPYAPTRLEDFVVAPGAPEAVAALHAAGLKTIVVTNQKDVGAGVTALSTVEAMHDLLRAAMPLDGIKVCTCVDECPCYKPNIGMFEEASAEFGLDLSASYMVGDRWRDVSAGIRAGCTTVFIDLGYSESLRDQPHHQVSRIGEACDLILQLERRRRE